MESVKLPISACFIAKHEADRLGVALDAIRGLVDDIVVVIDPASDSDGTAKVAAAHGARVLAYTWAGYGAQKRFAEQNAVHDWILSLDADEVISPALADEIRELFAVRPAYDFYRLRVVEVYPIAKTPRLWAEVTNIVRLFNRIKGMTSADAVHDRVEVPDGAIIGQMQGDVLHTSIRSLFHLQEKYDAYTTLQAKTLKRKPMWLLGMRLVTEFPMAFVQYYIGQRHITGGAFGLQVAMIKAHARWKRILKLMQAQRTAQ